FYRRLALGTAILFVRLGLRRDVNAGNGSRGMSNADVTVKSQSLATRLVVWRTVANHRGLPKLIDPYNCHHLRRKSTLDSRELLTEHASLEGQGVVVVFLVVCLGVHGRVAINHENSLQLTVLSLDVDSLAILLSHAFNSTVL